MSSPRTPEQRAKARERQARYEARLRGEPEPGEPASERDVLVRSLRAHVSDLQVRCLAQEETIATLSVELERVWGLVKRHGQASGEASVGVREASGKLPDANGSDASHNRALASDRISSSLLSLSQDSKGLGSQGEEIQDCYGVRASANDGVRQASGKASGRQPDVATLTPMIQNGGEGRGSESPPQAQEVGAVAEAHTGARPILRSEPTPPSGPRLTDELKYSGGRSARDRAGPPRQDEQHRQRAAEQLRALEEWSAKESERQ